MTVAIQQTIDTLLFLALLAGAAAVALGVLGGAGGAGAPVAAQILVVAVSVAAIIWPSTATAGTCKSDCHRGRVQAQGNKVGKPVNWAQPTPPTLVEGLQFLERLKAQLTEDQIAERSVGFAAAEQFMRNAAAQGGVWATDFRTSVSFPRKGQIRVDIEIRKGKAFVP